MTEQQYPYPPPQRVTSGVATAAFVLALIGVFGGWCMLGIPCLLAVGLGHSALNETKTGQRGGHGMAVAALILGYPFAALWILLLAFGVIGGAGR